MAGGEIKRACELRIIATPVQLITAGHGFEPWRLMPEELDRFYQVVKRTNARGVLLVSGDRHLAAIDRKENVLSYPLWEVSSSSLNIPMTYYNPDPATEPGPNRIGDPYFETNFALIDVDWDSRRINLSVRDQFGQPVRTSTLSLDDIQ